MEKDEGEEIGALAELSHELRKQKKKDTAK
jgi:hypothetical protein